MIMKPVDWRVATLFVQERHYSAVMPKLTKHYLGAYVDDELVGILTLGWGTNPMGTIRKMFPELTTADYYEIGKMCMDEKMPRNSESQMQSLTIKWMKENTPSVKYLYTWAMVLWVLFCMFIRKRKLSIWWVYLDRYIFK